MTKGTGNNIDSSASIADFVELGSFNTIGKNVVIQAAAGTTNPKFIIGDCNAIHDNVRIMVGDEGVFIKDWNVFHNSILLIGLKKVQIGHNGWFGQNTILDGSGGLTIGNGVRIGMYSQLWTHVASGELIEGCTLYAHRPTLIDDDVWLVGSCIVSSGITIGRRSICLINSMITKDVLPNKVYAGSPAKEMEKLDFYKPVTIEEKFSMMKEWVEQFRSMHRDISIQIYTSKPAIEIKRENDIVVIGVSSESSNFDQTYSYFDLNTKTYSKKLSSLERQFYRFIFGNKARFVPMV